MISKWRFAGLCAIVGLGSFGGSFVANRGIVTVHAQMPGTTDMRGRSFTVVDQDGRTVATLRATPAGSELTLDGRGQARVVIDGNGRIAIHNSAGRMVWNAPPTTGILPATE